jgi:TolB-like protein/DNA-binding winged helix-turn-helix (wHTH) protein/Flp pilus assembly protein TadD
MLPTSERAIFEFGDFRLDAGQRLLMQKADGQVVPLASRAFDTLLYFVEHSGELLAKNVLLKAIWPTTVVEENNLSQSIAAIRRALGERPGEHKYVVTIPGRGFRFVAAVTTGGVSQTVGEPEPAIQSSVPATAWRRRAMLVAAAAAVVLVVVAYLMRAPHEPTPLPRTLAILPFKPIVPTDDDTSLRYGMANTLIESLRKLEGVAVQPFTSVQRYGEPEQDALAAARQLGVATVLDGTIQRSTERLRVTARLLNVADGRELWSDQFDERFTDLFTVQDVIATRVVEALAIRLAGPADQQLRRRDTDDAEAYQLYVNGWFQRSRMGEEGFRRSIAFFEQAIARDPNYAQAYVGLADSYAMLGVFGAAAPDEVFPRALAAANRALQIDSELGEAHASLGHIKVQYERDLAGAEREYQRALHLVPEYATVHLWYGLHLAWTGHINDGIARLRKAQELEPLQLASSVNIGMLHYYARRYDAAIQQLRAVLTAQPDLDHARSFLGRAYLRKGDPVAAIAQFKLRKSLSVGSYADLGMALALAGRRPEAVAELNRVLALRAQRYVSAYDIASIHASLGDAEQVFAWLDRAVAERAGLLALLGGDPTFDGLRDDARMTALLARVNAPRIAGGPTN